MELEEEQNRRAIPKELLDLNFKIHTSQWTTLERLLEAIEDKIIMPILEGDAKCDEKIQHLIDLVSNKDNIFIQIEKISDINEKVAALDKLCFEDDTFHKDNLLDDTVLRLHIQDNQETRSEIISILNYRLKNWFYGRYWYLSEDNIVKFYYSDLSSLLSKIYLLNEMYKFSVCNREAVELFVYELVKEYPIILVHGNHINLAEDLKKKYNLKYRIISADYFNMNAEIFLLLEDAFNIHNNFNTRNNNVDFNYFSQFREYLNLSLRCMKKVNKNLVSDIKLKCSEYALTYQTKKDIPSKILHKMNNNKFLNWFGYVEIDKDCDLNKICQLEDEFESYMKKINLISQGKDHSIRFKKLGKQKAYGLYYPKEKAVCIDIRQPSSCTHEIFHMIDHISIKNNNLSELDSFSDIKDVYMELVIKGIGKLKEDDKIRKQFYGRSKYNKNYYFKPSEIFARCGELYVSDILKIKNSLINKDGGIYYPKDQGFLKLIKIYYSNMLRGIKRGYYG